MLILMYWHRNDDKAGVALPGKEQVKKWGTKAGEEITSIVKVLCELTKYEKQVARISSSLPPGSTVHYPFSFNSDVSYIPVYH